jgi:ATP-dependent helicase HrpB
MAFPWLTPPPVEAVVTAKRLLVRLDAVDDDGSLTELGKRMLSLPLHPRLARFMIESLDLGIEDNAALAAAMLTERDPLRGDQRPRTELATTQHRCDIADRLDRLQAVYRGDTSAAANVPAASHVKRVANQILRVTKSDSVAPPGNHASESDRLKQALLAAFPDRLARRRSPDSDRGVMVGGRGVVLDKRSLARPGELFLCIDVDSKGTDATVRAASVIEAEWLDQRLIHEVDTPFYDPRMQAVIARRRRCFDDLVLSETPIECQPGPEVAKLLAEQARLDLDSALPSNRKPIDAFINRVRFLTAQMPELDLPPLDDAAIDQVLLTLCQTRTSMGELKSAPWLDHLRGRYDYRQTQLIEQYAPMHITVPSGNSVAIGYAAGKPPVMKVRIQEIFGWKETPRIAGGKVAVQLHLLGPNYRPQQITEDLANFWSETYSHVRKELRRRYPKHHWPEDPTTATATRNGLKPRS